MPNNRMGNAIRMVAKEMRVVHAERDLYYVQSERTPGKTYEVKVSESCSCPDFQYRGVTCKHILLTRMIC